MDAEIDELADDDELDELEPSEDEAPQASSSKAQRNKKRKPGTSTVPLEQIDAMLRVDGAYAPVQAWFYMYATFSRFPRNCRVYVKRSIVSFIDCNSNGPRFLAGNTDTYLCAHRNTSSND
jgi:hypothetical protein